MAHQQKKVVTIGAGTGMAGLLSGLKKYTPDFLQLAAIVGVTDNGGHTGILRKAFKIPAVGDGRKCLLDGLAGKPHNFVVLPDGTNTANIYIAGLIQKFGSLSAAFTVLGTEIEAAGKVYPATDADVQICAQYQNGKVVVGEWQIIEYNHAKNLAEVYLSQEATACQDAAKAIADADYLIFGPGALRTGIISALLPKGIKEAIQASQAPMIYICNLMSQPGQTDGFTAADHLREIEKYGRMPSTLVFNQGTISEKVLKHYADLQMNGQSTPSYPVELGNVPSGIKVIKEDLVPKQVDLAKSERIGDFKKWTHLLVHDSQKLSSIIARIIDIQT